MVEGSPAVAVSLVHVRSVLQEEFTDDQGALGKPAWGGGMVQTEPNHGDGSLQLPPTSQNIGNTSSLFQADVFFFLRDMSALLSAL